MRPDDMFIVHFKFNDGTRKKFFVLAQTFNEAAQKVKDRQLGAIVTEVHLAEFDGYHC